MFKKLYIGSVSASFELENNLIYYNDKPYHLILNGKKHEKEFNTNVFSLFNLEPNTEYTIGTTLDDFELKFTTQSESGFLNILDFGAVGDGKTDCSWAIQQAINVCPKNGRIVVPEGTYWTRPILLKSNITLELKKGATLLASPDVKDYKVLEGEVPFGSDEDKKLQIATWEGNPFRCYQPFVAAYHAENIAIVGEGKIDGNGENGIWYIDPKNQPIGRPRLLFFNSCDGVTVHGITTCRSASWTNHPFFSKNVSYLDARIEADKDSPNTDGCNPESCDGVRIIGTTFSVGDDCIAIKSGKIYMGKKYKTPSRNITIRNCLMQHGHGAIVLGSEIAGGVKDLDVTRCLFRKTDRGLRVKTRRGRGVDSVIDGVVFENIKMENVLTPLVCNMFYFCDPDGKTEYVWSKEKLPVDDRTPYVGSLHFKNIVCEDYEYAAGFFYGLPEQNIGEIIIENVTFKAAKVAGKGYPAMMSYIDEYSKAGLYFNNVKNVVLKNVTLEGYEGEEIMTENVVKIERI